MNLDSIRSNKALCGWWASVMADPNFKAIWQMMNETHPLRFADTSPVSTPSSDKRLGTIEGYELALRRLELCSLFAAEIAQLPPASWPSLEQALETDKPEQS